jgi:uncharacterized membrane protein YphA (DoxX/SURF4 family)
MIVAIFAFHLPNAKPELRAFSTGWSHAFEAGIVFFSLLLIGPGRYSIDRK